jgi:transposase-like protein
MSAHQLHRMLKVTYKTAWFMFHRIREAMKEPAFAKLGGIVEADETYIGGKKSNNRRGRGATDKKAVLALVERDGRARSFHVANVSGPILGKAIREHVDPSARLMTDEWKSYKKVGKQLADHQTVAHSYGEYVRGDVFTNTVEGYFAILKRGVDGVYHHVSRPLASLSERVRLSLQPPRSVRRCTDDCSA